MVRATFVKIKRLRDDIDCAYVEIQHSRLTEIREGSGQRESRATTVEVVPVSLKPWLGSAFSLHLSLGPFHVI
jgi:hypothetical protein